MTCDDILFLRHDENVFKFIINIIIYCIFYIIRVDILTHNQRRGQTITVRDLKLEKYLRALRKDFPKLNS